MRLQPVSRRQTSRAWLLVVLLLCVLHNAQHCLAQDTEADSSQDAAEAGEQSQEPQQVPSQEDTSQSEATVGDTGNTVADAGASDGASAETTTTATTATEATAAEAVQNETAPTTAPHASRTTAAPEQTTPLDLTDPANVYLQALSILENITSFSDLLHSGLLYQNGRPATALSMNATLNRTTGKMYISNALGDVPDSDDCNPRQTSIRLNISNVDAAMIVYPRCIQVSRCGGCCRVPHVSCEPKYIETQLYSLLKLRPVYIGENVHLQTAGYHTVRVDRHLLCQCKCSLTPQSCGPLKTITWQQCKCECNVRLRCRSPTVFNENTCGCECPQHIVDRCEARLDPNTCSCGRSYMSAGGGGGGLPSNQTVISDASTSLGPSTTAASTTTASTRPTYPPTVVQPRSPCDGVTCRPTHGYYIDRMTGTCRCRRLRRPRPRPQSRYSRRIGRR